MMKKIVILILIVLSLHVWIRCNSYKGHPCNHVYESLQKSAEIEFRNVGKDYDDFENKFHSVVQSRIAKLSLEDLTELFDMLMENRNGIVSSVALDVIVTQFGEINTLESAHNLLKIYVKHRNFFDAGHALNLRCSFKKLDNLSLIALYKKEMKEDSFLRGVTEMIYNNEPCT